MLQNQRTQGEANSCWKPSLETDDLDLEGLKV